MKEFYDAIEQKLKASGYPGELNGRRIFEDICDQIEGKENGAYLVLSKLEEDVVIEYQITVYDEEFNLGLVTIRTADGEYQADFDA